MNSTVYLDQSLHIYLLLHCPVTGMLYGVMRLCQNDDNGLPRIILAGRGRMLKSLESHGIF